MKAYKKSTTKVKLTLQASNLPNPLWRIIKPTPFAVVTQLTGRVSNVDIVGTKNSKSNSHNQANRRHNYNDATSSDSDSNHDQGPSIIGQTEPISHTIQPEWTRAFILDYHFGTELFLDVSIYDNSNSTDPKQKRLLGNTVFEVGTVIGKRHNRSAKRLNPKGSGTVYAQIVPYDPPVHDDILQIGLSCEGMKVASKAYFEVYKRDVFESAQLWTPIYRSERILVKNGEDNTTTVVSWKTGSIPLHYFINAENNDSDSDGNRDDDDDDGDSANDPTFRIMFWGYHKIKENILFGSLETTLQGLTDVFENQSEMTLMNSQGKSDSEVVVRVTFLDICAEETETDNADAAEVIYNTRGNGNLPIPIRVPAAMSNTSPSPPTFLDYITGGCELDLSVAIDFTASNGSPLIAGTPHYIDKDSYNEYQKAIISVGRIISKYGTDKKSQVWGFGAKYEGVTRHGFQVGDESHVQGVKGILEAYESIFQRGVCMSSPVVYKDVIRIAAKKANLTWELATLEGRQSYSVLLILSHGCVSDVEATKAVLKQVVDSPLSIILVGIGE